MHIDLDNALPGQLQFIENFADGVQNRARFSSNVSQDLHSRRKVGSYQSGQEGVLVIQHNLAEGRLRFRNRPWLYAS